MHREAESAILHATKKFEERAQYLTFHVGGTKAFLWFHRSRKFVLQNVGGSEWVLSQNRLGAWLGKDCMNLVTVISEYTQVPADLPTHPHFAGVTRIL